MVSTFYENAKITIILSTIIKKTENKVIKNGKMT